jgi:thioredoxin-related protein
MYTTFKAEGTPHWLIFDEKGTLTHSIFGSMDGAQNRLYYALEEVSGT